MNQYRQAVDEELSWLEYMLSRRDAWYKCAAANRNHAVIGRARRFGLACHARGLVQHDRMLNDFMYNPMSDERRGE